MTIFSANSPVLTHLSASIEGIHTIRAFNVQQCLEHDFDQHYDSYLGTWFSHASVYGWFQFHAKLGAAFFCTAATFACVLVVDFNLFGKI